MGWVDILKGKVGLNASDIKFVEYIMKDGVARSVKGLMEDIYNEIDTTRKLSKDKVKELVREGRPEATRFSGSNHSIKIYFAMSPNYESRKIARNEVGAPILEYRYVGE
tara:strand:- start:1770 stop:2096 length:327 start_codon:yes stop_codon:yes gene_type:complete